MKRLLYVGAVLAGLIGLGGSAAEAQHGYGYRDNGYGPQYSTRSYRGYGQQFRGQSYNSWGRNSYRPHRDFHDTSHYDYHPTTIRPHRDHIDVTPGHYDYHQSGHWDRH